MLSWKLQRPATMVWAGLIAREVAIFIGHTYRVSKLEGSFGFGWETGRIARSIASGQGFSSPFVSGTGPTAWLAPIYPYLLAGVFKVFGVYTSGSAIAILSLNSIFSALTILPIYFIARRTFGSRAALWSGWLAAMFPYAWYWAIKWAWETSLATLLLTCVFLLSMRMAGIGWIEKYKWEFTPDARWNDWLLFGLLWGLIALVNPSLLLWLPFCGLWLLVIQLRTRQGSRAMWQAIAAGAVFVVVLSPWVARNDFVFHRFIPLRSNFGAELRMGNADDAVGLWRFWMHPSSNVLELQKYRQMGEIAYVHLKQQQALEFIRAHPAKFAKLCVRRAVYFWYGTPRDSGMEILTQGRNIGFLLSSILAFGGLWIMWCRRHPATFLFASLLFAAPLIYYVTFPHPRYRAPIEPEMLILIVGLFLAAEPRGGTTASDEETRIADRKPA
jgi:4-amino-4-deoxy-L-arabinose transferase-like glycosyltransferase